MSQVVFQQSAESHRKVRLLRVALLVGLLLGTIPFLLRSYRQIGVIQELAIRPAPIWIGPLIPLIVMLVIFIPLAVFALWLITPYELRLAHKTISVKGKLRSRIIRYHEVQDVEAVLRDEMPILIRLRGTWGQWPLTLTGLDKMDTIADILTERLHPDTDWSDYEEISSDERAVLTVFLSIIPLLLSYPLGFPISTGVTATIVLHSFLLTLFRFGRPKSYGGVWFRTLRMGLMVFTAVLLVWIFTRQVWPYVRLAPCGFVTRYVEDGACRHALYGADEVELSFSTFGYVVHSDAIFFTNVTFPLQWLFKWGAHRFEIEHPRAIALSRSRHLVASSYSSLKVWDASEKLLLYSRQVPGQGYSYYLENPRISADGTLIAYDYHDTTGYGLAIDSVISGEHIKRFPFADQPRLTFAPYRNRYAYYDQTLGEQVHIVNGFSHGIERILVAPTTCSCDQLQFSADGRFLTTFNSPSSIIVWDVTTGDVVQIIKIADDFSRYSIAISPGGEWLAIATVSRDELRQDDGDNFEAVSIAIWDVEGGHKITESFVGEVASMSEIEVSPDGKWLVLEEYGEGVTLFSVEALLQQ